MGKRKTLSEETSKQKMDAPLNIDSSDHSANPLPNPPETFPPEERPIHEAFMREALAMVCPSRTISSLDPILMPNPGPARVGDGRDTRSMRVCARGKGHSARHECHEPDDEWNAPRRVPSHRYDTLSLGR